MQETMAPMGTHSPVECKTQSVLTRLLDWYDYHRRDPMRFRALRVLGMIAALWVMNVADLHLTLVAIGMGDFYEVNPVARYFVNDPASLVLFKISLVTLSTTLLFLLRVHWAAEMACLIMTGIYGSLMVLWGIYFHLLGA
jgi:hypothetical protein